MNQPQVCIKQGFMHSFMQSLATLTLGIYSKEMRIRAHKKDLLIKTLFEIAKKWKTSQCDMQWNVVSVVFYTSPSQSDIFALLCQQAQHLPLQPSASRSHSERVLTAAVSEGAQAAANLSGCLAVGQNLSVIPVLTVTLDAICWILLQ